MAQVVRLLLCFLTFFCASEAFKVLIVFSFPGKSHSILGDGYSRLLLNAGHEVTMITPFPQKNTHPNLTQIDVSSNVKYYPAHLINLKSLLDKEVDPSDMTSFFDFLLNLGNMTFSNENVQRMLHDPTQEFDVIIIEWLFSDLASGLSVVYNCPYIWFSTIEPHWIVLSLIDEPPNPAYNPDAISDIAPPFTFLQRVKELWKLVSGFFYRTVLFSQYENKLYDTIYGPVVAKRGKVLPSYDEVRHNASLMLGNSHVSLGQAIRLPQSYKNIAGYHIDPNVKPLPEDLKNLLENAKHGLIYFSMGSNLKSKDMPDKLKRSLLNMLGQLKYTILWKFEEVLTDLPKNVHIVNWAPQTSILAHPKCILFITHGGLLSTTEAVHFAVPTIGIPVFADQFVNVARAVNKGFAKRVDLSYDMADHLKIAIEETVSNPRYRERVKELSLVYHDRPVPPGAELVHWVEHVVRTRGAPHLRSPALMVPWYQKMYLDLLVLILTAILVLKTAIKRLFCARKKTTISQKKKN